MQRMVRLEAEILASMGGFSVDFSGLMTRTSRKGTAALSNSISTVNWMEGLELLRMFRKFCNHYGPWGQTTNMSPTYRNHSDGLYYAGANFSKCSINMLLTIGDSFPYHAIFWMEELIVHLKICGSQTNFHQFHDGFDLQGRPFHQCVIIMEHISDDL